MKNTNQYKLIYPSMEHPESEYQKFLEHAHFLYEQFTGSYSKKQTKNTDPPKMAEKFVEPKPIINPPVIDKFTKIHLLADENSNQTTERDYINMKK